jgi:hypothetical protein
MAITITVDQWSYAPHVPVHTRPPGLRLAIAAVLAEGLAVLGFGVWLGFELLTQTPSNEDVARGSAVYFLVLGVLVLLVAWGLWRRSWWSHGAAVFLQLLALPIAWYMLRGDIWWSALLLTAVAVAALVALLRPQTRAALGRE